MADNKKSFILYADYITTIEELTDDEAGKLMKHLFRYVNDKNPEPPEDRIVKLSFEPIKQQLKRDLKEWSISKKEKSNSGKIGNLKRWNKDLYEKVINEEISVDEAEIIAKDRKAIKCVAKIAVNVNDTVNVNVIKKEKSFPVMPKVEDVGELPELKINSSIELLRITQQTDATKTDIEKLWVVFKIQNLTGKKYYADVEAVHSHFINWVKTQRITKPIRAPEKEKQYTPLRTADYYK